MEQAINDIGEAAQNCAWAVIDPSEFNAQPSAGDRPPLPGVAADIDAILLPVVLEGAIPQELLNRLKNRDGDSIGLWMEDPEVTAPPPKPPVVAVIFAIEELEDEDVVVRAQKELLDGGADAAVVKGSSVRDLRLNIRMALTQAHVTREVAKQAEDDLKRRMLLRLQQLQNVVAQGQAATDSATAAAQEAMGMVWNASHVLFRDFPNLDTTLPAELRTGERVGPLRLQGGIGQGSFGVVVAAMNEESQEEEAVKVIAKNDVTNMGSARRVWKEISVLRTLSHENLASCYGALQGPNHIFIRMELVRGSNLFRALRAAGDRFIVADAQKIQVQLSKAIAYCHERGIAHCDLKPENIGLCTSERYFVKVLDFGSARRTDVACCRPVGTVPFMAPEVMEASATAAYQPAGSDVFAFGVVLLEMLCGIGWLNRTLGWAPQVRPSPVRAAELRVFLQGGAALVAALEQEVGPLPADLHLLIARALRADHGRRWSAAAIRRSPWLQHRRVVRAS